MATRWKNVFVEVPADASTVWIVRIPYFDTPVQATFDNTSGTFTWTDSGTTARTIPLDQVFKWRDL